MNIKEKFEVKEKFEDKILKLPPVEVAKMHLGYGRCFRIPKLIQVVKKDEKKNN